MIKSCWESLNYVADGVVSMSLTQYIDWAADQGSLSFAYEVGKTFTNDLQIDSAMENVLEDFSVVFEETVSDAKLACLDSKEV